MEKYATKKMQVKEPGILSSLLGLVTDPFASAYRLALSQDSVLLFAYAIFIFTLGVTWFFGPYLLMDQLGFLIRLDRVLQVGSIAAASLFTSYTITLFIFLILGLRISPFRLFFILSFGAMPFIFFLWGISLYDFAIDRSFDIHLKLTATGFSSLGLLDILLLVVMISLSIGAIGGGICAICDYPMMLSCIFGVFCLAITYVCFFIIANVANDLMPGYSVGLQSMVMRLQILPMLGLAKKR